MMHPVMGIGMGLFWLIAVLVVAYLIYKLIKSEKILVPSRPVIRSAEDILSERYAKGELTREQSDERRPKKSPVKRKPWRPNLQLYHIFICVSRQTCLRAEVANHL
jgi:hypothetical protein